MLSLISPAKKLDFEDPAHLGTHSKPEFLDEARELVSILKNKSRGELKSLMGISDNLAELNYNRYQSFKTPFNLSNAKQAVLTFQGDTYKGLDAASLSESDLNFAQDHLRVLSGLYGLLRPLDLMQPYRLEMGTKLSNSEGEDLYDFWSDELTKACNETVLEYKHKAVVNLASKEYISAIDPDALNVPFITCHFKKIKDGKARVIGILAKKARGMMARYIIQNRIEDPEGLKSFKKDGYQYSADDSTQSDLVFVQTE